MYPASSKMGNRVTSTSVDLDPKTVRILPSNVYEAIQGITTLGDRLYIVKDKSREIDVFNAADYTRLDPIPVDISYPYSLVACSKHNCLYSTDESYSDTTDNWTYYIHKVVLSTSSLEKWVVQGMPVGLSIMKSHNLLVSIRDPQPYESEKLLEYTTEGKLLRVINLDISIDYLYHAVELSTDIFVICHTGVEHHRVCTVDGDGQILRTYGGFLGSGVGELNLPLNLATDKHGNVFVADRKNNRVQLLSSNSDYLEEVKITEIKLNTPHRIHFDQVTSRLYVSDRNSPYY